MSAVNVTSHVGIIETKHSFPLQNFAHEYCFHGATGSVIVDGAMGTLVFQAMKIPKTTILNLGLLDWEFRGLTTRYLHHVAIPQPTLGNC